MIRPLCHLAPLRTPVAANFRASHARSPHIQVWRRKYDWTCHVLEQQNFSVPKKLPPCAVPGNFLTARKMLCDLAPRYMAYACVAEVNVHTLSPFTSEFSVYDGTLRRVAES